MKIALFGNKSSTSLILSKILELTAEVVVHQVNQKHSKDIYGYKKIDADQKKKSFELKVFDNYSLSSDADISYFSEQKFGLGISSGWQRLIPNKILKSFKYGVYGWHASPFTFPDGRGRSPLNWGIRLGMEQVNLYCFRYKPGVDDGDIFNVTPIALPRGCTIGELQAKTIPFILSDTENIIHDCKNDKVQLAKQAKKAHLKLPKLSPLDGEILLGIHTPEQILAIIKATSQPFPGAFVKAETGTFRIWDANIFVAPVALANRLTVMKPQVIDQSLVILFDEKIMISKSFDFEKY